MHRIQHHAHPWLWPAETPAPLKAGAAASETVHSALYRGRRITVRTSGVPDYAYRAFVDGWPVSNRRRGDPGGFPAIDQATGRCKVVIDREAPARRWRGLHRLARQARTALNTLLRGDRRA